MYTDQPQHKKQLPFLLLWLNGVCILYTYTIQAQWIDADQCICILQAPFLPTSKFNECTGNDALMHRKWLISYAEELPVAS